MHPLHTKEFLEQFALDDGGLRRTGRSTAIALLTIATAIRNPRQEILLEDHCRPSTTVSLRADRHLADMTREIIRKLDLKHIHVLPRVNHENHHLPCFKVVFDKCPRL